MSDKNIQNVGTPGHVDWGKGCRIALCAKHQREHAYEIEICRLRQVMVSAAAYLAREMQDEDIPDATVSRIRNNVISVLEENSIIGK